MVIEVPSKVAKAPVWLPELQWRVVVDVVVEAWQLPMVIKK